MRQGKNLTWGLFLLRFGLGAFLCLWAIDKLVNPDAAAVYFSHHYLFTIEPSIIMIIGGLELVLSLLLMLGMYKTWTYGLAFIIEAAASIATWHELIAPFGANRLYLSNIPLLLAFAALFVMRKLDNRWTLSKRPSMFAG